MARSIVDAVGRIASTQIGTGFIIDKANRLVLTCRHVVHGRAVASFELPRLGFLVECDVEESPAGKHDWALLTARASLPLQASELPLHQFRWNGCLLPFTSYGFATFYATAGANAGFVSGEVRGVDRAMAAEHDLSIDLRASELLGRSHEEVRGVSGAPCLVNGVAVGIVWASLTGAAGSTLRAIPADVLHQESDRIPVADALRLPYEEFFLSRIEHVGRHTLEIAGNAIGLCDTDGDDTAYRRRLARAMISGGLTTTVDALIDLHNVDEQKAKELAVLAESLWIDALSAETAATLHHEPLPKSLRWNAVYDTTIIDLLRRASWHHSKTAPHWHKKGICLVVHLPMGEANGASLICEIAEQFKHETNNNTSDKIKSYLSRMSPNPVVAVVFAPVPSAEVLEKLAACYPGLRVLFVAPQHRTDGPHVTPIQPDLPAGREEEAHAAREIARLRLSVRRELVIDDKDFRR
jgi:hypothetical protein